MVSLYITRYRFDFYIGHSFIRSNTANVRLARSDALLGVIALILADNRTSTNGQAQSR